MIFTGVTQHFYHSPEDDTTSAYLDFLKSATRSIHIVIFGFHLPLATDVLIAMHQSGVDVSIILDHTQAAGVAERGEVQRLVDAGVPLAVGTSSSHHAIIHDKFTVVDGHMVETGSWNYSLSATEEDNFMLIQDNPELAAYFLGIHNFVLNFIIRSERAMQPHAAVLARLARADGHDAAPDGHDAAVDESGDGGQGGAGGSAVGAGLPTAPAPASPAAVVSATRIFTPTGFGWSLSEQPHVVHDGIAYGVPYTARIWPTLGGARHTPSCSPFR